jgi:uncharacterized protein (DUF1330 family)
VSVYALNLFDVADRAEYLEYARRSPAAVSAHGGRVVALGEFQEAIVGDIAPRQVLILVEWESREAFDSYCNDSLLADLHPTARTVLRVTSGTCSTDWTTSDRSSNRVANPAQLPALRILIAKIRLSPF